MRGLIVSVFVLVGLDIVLSSPASRVSTVLNRPSHWLAAWMDASVPLIPSGHLADASSAGSSGGGGGSAAGAGAVKNPTIKPKIPGHCPPGYIWNADRKVCMR